MFDEERPQLIALITELRAAGVLEFESVWGSSRIPFKLKLSPALPAAPQPLEEPKRRLLRPVATTQDDVSEEDRFEAEVRQYT